jgi:hypothetical protein
MNALEWFKKHAAFFFPEMIPFAYIVLISPIWLVQLLGRGHYLAAFIFVLGVVSSAFAFYWGCWRNTKLAIYAAMALSLLTAGAVYNHGK